MNKHNYRVGRLPQGPRNSIADVAGVQVGHYTLAQGAQQTGVTVVLPHQRDPFLYKIPAGVCVINGFGKSVGLVQIQELGQLETPIVLTNTFSVSDMVKAQLRHACQQHPEIGRELPTINPVVLECNDGYLNDIQSFALTADDYLRAVNNATVDFALGAVGAGRGMSSFGVKGGLGSASRCVELSSGQAYTVGVLVLANFGRPEQLIFRGHPIGEALVAALLHRGYEVASHEPEKGSIIMLVATDAPLGSRQLQRVSRRCAAGLARTGSVYGHGSGDIAMAFTTAYTNQQRPVILPDTVLDPIFSAVAEATEHAILRALTSAVAVTGREGNERIAITSLNLDWQKILYE